MNILMIGDVVGNPGRTILRKALPAVFRKFEIDYCVANVDMIVPNTADSAVASKSGGGVG